MPNPTLQDAIKEAYACAPAGIVILNTLEFRHPLFTAPLRLVSDTQDWLLTLEPDAPADPGEEVAFIGFGFSLDLPPVEDNAQPEAVVAIDNVSREILLEIEAAVTSASPVEMTYRPYLSDDTGGPQMDPPLHLVVTAITATPTALTLKASFGDYTNKRFPGASYTLESFPGLVAAQ